MARNKIAKMLALSLATTMCLSMVACGEKSETGKSSETKNDVSSEVKNDADTEKEEETKNYWEMLFDVSDTSELPDWEGETLEITIWCANGTDTEMGMIAEGAEVYEEIERVTGIRINWEDSFGNGGDNMEAKVAKMTATGDFPTMVTMGDFSILEKLYENDYLVDLTEYYADGEPLKEVLEYILPSSIFEPNVYSKMRTDDGQYYLLPRHIGVSQDALASPNSEDYTSKPYYNEEFQKAEYGESTSNNRYNWGELYVRDDVLQAIYPDTLSAQEILDIYAASEEANAFTTEQVFDVPLYSPEDFIDFLYKVEDVLANGDFVGVNGKAVETTYGPATDADNIDIMSYLPYSVYNWQAHQFGGEYYYNIVREGVGADGTGLVQRAITTKYYEDWLRKLNKLVSDDVMSKDSFVDDATAFTEKLNNGQYAVLYGPGACNVTAYGGMLTDANGKTFGYRPIYINQPLSEEFGGFLSMRETWSWGIFKNDYTEEQIDQIVHFYTYMVSDIGKKNLTYGPATSGLWTEDENGVLTFVDEDLHAWKMGELTPADVADKIVAHGLFTDNTAVGVFWMVPRGFGGNADKYIYTHIGPQKQEGSVGAWIKYAPASVSDATEDVSYAGNADAVPNALASFINEVEGLKQFADAKSGYENLIKKVIVAENFDAAYAELIQYMDDNGATEEAVAELNAIFVDANREELIKLGIISK